MADASVTASAVSRITAVSASVFGGFAGQALTAGQLCYQTNAANGQWFVAATTNQLTAGLQNGLAFTLGAANGVNQPITLQRTGQLYLGVAALVDGEQYTVSNNAGNIGAAQDRLTGQFDSYVGYAINTTTLQLPASGPVYKSEARTTNA
jgi:hypothetical protein